MPRKILALFPVLVLALLAGLVSIASDAEAHVDHAPLMTRMHVGPACCPVTPYEVQALDPEGSEVTFSWSIDVKEPEVETCEQGFSSSGSQASWNHGGAIRCNHDTLQDNIHEGTITAAATDGWNVVGATTEFGANPDDESVALATSDIAVTFEAKDGNEDSNWTEGTDFSWYGMFNVRASVQNVGVETVHNVNLVLLVPHGLMPDATPSGCESVDHSFHCPIGAIAPGDRSVMFTARWQGLPLDLGVEITAIALMDELDDDLSNNRATATVTLRPPFVTPVDILFSGDGSGTATVRTADGEEIEVIESTTTEVPQGATTFSFVPSSGSIITTFDEGSACRTPICVVEVMDDLEIGISFEQSSALADLAVQITPDPFLREGTRSEIILSVSNRGPNTATGVTAVVTWEGTMEIVDLGADCALVAGGGALFCQLGSIPPGSWDSRIVGMASGTGDSPHGEYLLDATVRANEHDPHLDSNHQSFLGRVHASLRAADTSGWGDLVTSWDWLPRMTEEQFLEIEQDIQAGEQMRLLLSLKNELDEEVREVSDASVIIHRPPDLHVVPSGVACEGSPPDEDTTPASLACYIGDIAPGEVVVVELLVQTYGYGASSIMIEVAGAEPDADILDNTITIPIFTEFPGGSPVAEEGVALPDLVVTKTPRSFSQAGEIVNSTIVVQNQGDAGATGILVEDVAVFDHTPLSVTSTGGDCSLAGERMLCMIEALAPGAEVEIHVSMRVGDVPEPYVVNRAIAVANEPEENLTNNLATAWSTVFKGTSVAPEEPPGDGSDEPPTADLSVTKVDLADPVSIGDPIQYDITVKNNGPSDATGVTLVDRMLRDHTGATQERLPVEWFVGPGCNRPTLTCIIGDLAAGDSVTMSLKLSPLGHELVFNVASVSGNEIDLFPSNNRDTEWTTSLPVEEPLDCRPRGCALFGPGRVPDAESDGDTPPDPDPNALSADIEVTIADPLFAVQVGVPYWYTVSVTNHGPDGATDVLLRHNLPWEADLDGFLQPISGICAYAGLHEIDCALGDMAPGDSIDVRVSVVPWLDGLLWTRASAFAAEPDPDRSDNIVFETTIAEMIPPPPPPNGTADLNLSKVASVQRAAARENLTFTLNLTNTGPDVARDVVLQDFLPAGFHVLEAKPTQGTCSRTGICLLGNVSVDQTVHVNITGFATSEAAKGSVNFAYAKGSTADPDISNNAARAHVVVDRGNVTPAIPVTTVADVAVTAASPTSVRSGSIFTQTIVVTNHGPASASGVGLVVAAPGGLEQVSLAVPGGTTCVAHVTSCLIGDLQAGSSRSLVLTHRVPTGAAPGDLVTTATVLANEDDSDLTDNTALTTTTATRVTGGGGGGGAGTSGASTEGTGSGPGSDGRVIAKAQPGQRSEGPNGQGQTRFSANVDTERDTTSLRVSFPQGSPLLDLDMGIRGGGGPVQVEVTVYDGPPEGMAGLPLGIRPSAFYVDISLTGATAEGGSFALSVPRSYMEAQGVEQVFVLHFDGAAWVEVQAVVDSEDERLVVLRVTTPSFSPFMVVHDEAPPEISGGLPQGEVDGRSLILSADWSDNRGIDAASVKVSVDDVLVPIKADTSGFRHTLDLDLLRPGIHTVMVRVSDVSGLAAQEEWTFETASAGPVEETEPSPAGAALLTVALLAGLLGYGRKRRRA